MPPPARPRRSSRRRPRKSTPAALLLLVLMLVLIAAATAADPADAAAEEQQEVMPLPAPEEGGAAGGGVPQLKFGEKMRFDELGPIIVNKDGTTRRITNWGKMTEWEKERTLDRIARRNKERMAELQGQGQDDGGGRAEL